MCKTRTCWRVQQRRSGWVLSKEEENWWAMMFELVDQPLPATHATLKKWNEKSRSAAEKWSEMSLTVPTFRVRVCIKFYDRIWRWRRCVRSWFWNSWHQNRRKNEFSLQKHFWTIVKQIQSFLDGSSQVMSCVLRPWSAWTDKIDKKYMELNGAALNVRRPCVTTRKTSFPKDK